MAFCIQCGHRNPDEGRFCDQCGNPLVWGADKASQPESPLPSVQICPGCGKRRSDGERFCTGCGHRFDAAAPAESVASLPGGPKITMSPQGTEPQKSDLGDGRKRKSPLLLGAGIAVGLVASGLAIYVIMSPAGFNPSPQPALASHASSEPSPPPAPSAPLPTAAPSASINNPAVPQPDPPLATEPTALPVVAEKQLNPAPPAAVTEPPPAPARQKPAPVKKKPAPPTSASSTAKKPAPLPEPPSQTAEKPVQPASKKKSFSCSDLPFGLLVACGLEGKDVIRKCAPDLKMWNHDIPGCSRQR